MEKPIITVDLQGPDANVFSLMEHARNAIITAVRRPGFRLGRTAEELARDRQNAEIVAEQMTREVMHSHTYGDALDIIRKYVTIQDERR